MYYFYKNKWLKYANFIAYFSRKYFQEPILYTIVDMWISLTIFHFKRISKDSICVAQIYKILKAGW